MIIRPLLLLLLTITISPALTLQNVYYFEGNDINISTIFPGTKNDAKLFTLTNNNYSKKIKSRILVRILKQRGINGVKYGAVYVHFIKKSPIDVTKIENKVQEYYKKRYQEIQISSISINPRHYISKLPKNYTVHLRSRDYLFNGGTLYIKTLKHEKIFFDFLLNAKVAVYKSKQKIHRNTELSKSNTKKSIVTLERFRALPVQEIEQDSLQSKHQILDNKVITVNDVTKLDVVKRDSMINIHFRRNNMVIEVNAKALRDGKVNDIIPVQVSNRKILKAKIIGRNLAEIR